MAVIEMSLHLSPDTPPSLYLFVTLSPAIPHSPASATLVSDRGTHNSGDASPSASWCSLVFFIFFFILRQLVLPHFFYFFSPPTAGAPSSFAPHSLAPSYCPRGYEHKLFCAHILGPHGFLLKILGRAYSFAFHLARGGLGMLRSSWYAEV
jgi:hypothetical protein